MSFTGKATYLAGSTLPEIAEDVSDLIGIASPFETPLLDALGDPARSAHSTIHEWLEDALIPNTDTIATVTDTSDITVHNVSRFRVGDQLRVDGASEIILVTAVNTGTSALTLQRGYGGTSGATLAANQTLYILGSAAIEGDDAAAAISTNRSRHSNYTQIFTTSVQVSGSELAVTHLGVNDELDYQKAQRTRELLRDLENCVINGIAAATNPQGTSTTRRTMRGIIPAIQTNHFVVNSGGFPADEALTEQQLNLALRDIWLNSSAQIDLIVVGGPEKRQINNFVTSNRRFDANTTTYQNLISVYESDYGVCRVVMSRSLPAGTVLLLDSSRIEVLPLAGRSFQYKPLAITGDSQGGQIVGEYTVEMRNENAHGMISGFTNS